MIKIFDPIILNSILFSVDLSTENNNTSLGNEVNYDNFLINEVIE